jgi:hypothetical protein
MNTDSITALRERKALLDSAVKAACDAFTADTGLGVVSFDVAHLSELSGDSYDGENRFTGHKITANVEVLRL